MLLLLILVLISSTPSILSARCDGRFWKVNYSPNNCATTSGGYVLKCYKNPNKCGMRLDGKARLGKGIYAASMKAAPGTGVVTTFYLYQYGRNNKRNKPWNEIDIEIRGRDIKNGKSKIVTNVWTGKGEQNDKYHTVNFNAAADYHDYEIKIDNNWVYWFVDGKRIRKWAYKRYSDFTNTVKYKRFQAEISLWGKNKGWAGDLRKNKNRFPLRAYYKNIVIAERQKTIALKSYHGTYVRVKSNGDMDVKGRSTRSTGARLLLYQSVTGSSRYYLESMQAKLVKAENSRKGYDVNAVSIAPKSYERWELKKYKGNKVAFKSYHKKYLRATSWGTLDATASRRDDWELFTMITTGSDAPPTIDTNWDGYMYKMNKKYFYGIIFILILLVIINIFVMVWRCYKNSGNVKTYKFEMKEDDQDQLLYDA